MACYAAGVTRAQILTGSLVSLGLLAGCAGTGSYPSLARRPAERQYGTAAVATSTAVPTPTPTLAPDAPLVARLAAIRAAAQTAHGRFTKGLPAGERLTAAARGQAPGDDGWSQAQVALAELFAARTQTALALSDLDHLLVEATETSGGADSAEIEAIGDAHVAVGALIESEDADLDRMAGRLRG